MQISPHARHLMRFPSFSTTWKFGRLKDMSSLMYLCHQLNITTGTCISRYWKKFSSANIFLSDTDLFKESYIGYRCQNIFKVQLCHFKVKISRFSCEQIFFVYEYWMSCLRETWTHKQVILYLTLGEFHNIKNDRKCALYTVGLSLNLLKIISYCYLLGGDQQYFMI